MYFFLGHLSLVDLSYSSVSVPRMLENLMPKTKTIPVKGCLAQAFFVFVMGGTEAFLLAVMAYDRYAAICHPLLYEQKMSNRFCEGLVLGSWGLAILNALINTLLAVNLDFCDYGVIHNYSCEIPSLFPLSCSDVSTNATVLFWSFVIHASVTLLPVLSSYGCIFSTILNMRSTTSRSKAFSTCTSHLTIVVLYYGSACLRYTTPTSGSPTEIISSLQYNVITPMLNPLIYSLKNKEVMTALRKMLGKCCQRFDSNDQKEKAQSAPWIPAAPQEGSTGDWEMAAALLAAGSQGLVTIKDVSLCFSQEEWRSLDPSQTDFYGEYVMQENCGIVVSLRFPIPKLDMPSQLEGGEEQWVPDPQDLEGRDILKVTYTGDGSEHEGDTPELAAEPPRIHQRVHAEGKSYQGQEMGESPGAQKQQLAPPVPKCHVCTECGKSFGRRHHLVRHWLTHTGEKPFHCPRCEKSFGRKHHLDRHLLTHQGQSPGSSWDRGTS
ncbi:olfactory receptor 8S1-like, partial [Sigmodon hispidus]